MQPLQDAQAGYLRPFRHAAGDAALALKLGVGVGVRGALPRVFTLAVGVHVAAVSRKQGGGGGALCGRSCGAALSAGHLPTGRAVRQALQGMAGMMQGIQGMPNMGGMPMGPGMHPPHATCPMLPGARFGAGCPVPQRLGVGAGRLPIAEEWSTHIRGVTPPRLRRPAPVAAPRSILA